MATSIIRQRALSRIQDSGFAKAKKLADLALKTNTDTDGSYTSRGYELAIAYLQPYLVSSNEKDAIDAQRLVAGYENKLSGLQVKEKTQEQTIANFKLQEEDAYFTNSDGDYGTFRDPSQLVGATSEALDQLVVGVVNAIDEADARGDNTDALRGYLNDISRRADTMRDVNNKFMNGELTQGQTLDGFGYYVDTNPVDGSIRRAAFLPVGMVPDGMTTGFRRLTATTNLNGALVPVYAPATKDAYGEYRARIGNAEFTGDDKAALMPSNPGDITDKNLITDGMFSIANRDVYRLSNTSLNPGSFGEGYVGLDAEGKPVTAVLYKGMDGKLYKLDEQTAAQMQQDPMMKTKLEGYRTRFSPTEMKELYNTAEPITPEKIGGDVQVLTQQQAEMNKPPEETFFQKAARGFTPEERAQNRQAAIGAIKNVPDKVMEGAEKAVVHTGDAAIWAGKKIIQGGKAFFRGLGNAGDAMSKS
jgi:hypothetical protein